MTVTAGSSPLNKRRLTAAALAVISLALGLWLPAVIAGRLPDGSPQADAFIFQYFLSALQEILMIGFPAAIYFLYKRQSGFLLLSMLKKPDPLSVGTTMLSAVSFTMAGSLLMAFWLALLVQWGYEPRFVRLIAPSSTGQFLLALLMAGAIPAVAEELLFRGALMRVLRGWRGDTFAVVVTAFIFAALHLSLEGFPVLLVIGLLLGRLAIKNGSLVLPVLFHFVYNASAIAVNAAEATPKPFLMFLCTFIFSVTVRLLLRQAKKEEL